MNMPRINISPLNSNIQINKSDAKLHINGQHASMQVYKTGDYFEIDKRDAKIHINNYGPDKQLYRKKIMDMTEEIAQEGQIGVSKGISRYVSDGETMMRIENKGNVIPRLAKKNSEPSRMQVNIDYFPKEPIQISASEASMQVNSAPAKIEVESHSNLQIEAEAPRVEINVDRYPKVIVDVEGFKGNNIDYLV